jgi:hypothetical protein
LLDEADRAGVLSNIGTLETSESFMGSFGVPKSSFLAGLLGLPKVSVKREGVALTDIGLL